MEAGKRRGDGAMASGRQGAECGRALAPGDEERWNRAGKTRRTGRWVLKFERWDFGRGTVGGVRWKEGEASAGPTPQPVSPSIKNAARTQFAT